MRAALRIAWLYLTLFPIQRWLGIIAAVVVGLAIAVLAVGASPSPAARAAIAMALTLPAVLFLLPGLLVAGPVFRYLSAPATHGLLPRFRLRMLGSLLALTAIVGGPVVLFMLGISILTTAQVPSIAFLVVFAFISACPYFYFRLTHMTRRVLVEALAWFLGIALVASAAEASAVERMLPAAGTALLVLGWTAFALWYCNVRRVAGVDLSGQQLRSAGALRLPAVLTHTTAAEIVLTGRGPLTTPTALLGAAGLAAGLCLLLALVTRAGLADSAVGPVELTTLVAIGGGAGALAVHQFGSRARYLWLLSADSRAELLGRIGAVYWRLLLYVGAFVALLMTGMHFLVAPVGIVHAALALALFVGLSTLAAYLTLARARNLGPIEIAGWMLAVLSTVVAYAGMRFGAWQAPVLLGVVAIQLALAALLRLVAQRRWRTVDWLQYRPFRAGSLGPRA